LAQEVKKSQIGRGTMRTTFDVDERRELLDRRREGDPRRLEHSSTCTFNIISQ
jgi:hypothetical protein